MNYAHTFSRRFALGVYSILIEAHLAYKLKLENAKCNIVDTYILKCIFKKLLCPVFGVCMANYEAIIGLTCHMWHIAQDLLK